MIIIKRVIYLLVISLFVVSGSIKADDKDRSYYYDYGKQFYAEAFLVNDIGNDSMEALILFRFSYSLMTFSKSLDFRNNSDKYTAFPRIYIDFRDSSGVIKKRESWTDTVIVRNYDSTKSKISYYPGYVRIVLPKTSYQINIEFRNDQNNVLKKERLSIDEIGKTGKTYLLKPILVSKDLLQNNSTSPVIDGSFNEVYEPFILGGNVDFRAKNARILTFIKYMQGYDSYNYIIEYIPDKSGDIWENVAPLSGQVRAEKSNGSIEFKHTNTNNLLFTLQTGKGIANKSKELEFGYLDIPLPATYMYPGDYRLKVFGTDATGDTLNFNFKVEWVDMPVSLKNPDYAAELMYYLLPDAAYEVLNSGTRLEILKKIWKYWISNDPSKFTVYNEAMAQYFKRADYAFFNFQTISEKDGAKTDRGKVYILKDSPTNIKRRLEDDKTVEEWNYNKLKQVYIFETNSAGKYKLKKIENLAGK
jgi:GWxTD domain-containing protein